MKTDPSPHPTSADKLEVGEMDGERETLLRGLRIEGDPDNELRLRRLNKILELKDAEITEQAESLSASRLLLEYTEDSIAKLTRKWQFQMDRADAAEANCDRKKEALNQIDALDFEDHIFGVSHDACRGLIGRMGQIARAALNGGAEK